MLLSASSLRQNIYKILDRILATGIPVEIERKGRRLKIITLDNQSKIKNLKKRKVMNDRAQDYIHLDWQHEWKK